MPLSARAPHLRLGAIVALGIAAGLGVWLGTRDDGGGRNGSPTGTTAIGPTGRAVVPISASGLETLVGALHRPIYWAGEQPGRAFELTQDSGNVYVRYLPVGARVGTKQALLTVGTYPVQGAFAVTQSRASQAGSVRVPARGAVAFYNKSAPTSVYLAFPGVDYQIEVYDPSAAEAKQLVEAGKIEPVQSSAGAPAIVSAARLKTVANSLGHALYWAGPMAGTAYELRRSSGDRTYVRYLPQGAAAGADVAALTIGTYGVANAFAVTQQAAKTAGAVQVPVTSGGIAFYSRSAPTNVYVAYPGANVQLEVYDPSAARAQQLVTSGKIVRVG